MSRVPAGLPGFVREGRVKHANDASWLFCALRHGAKEDPRWVTARFIDCLTHISVSDRMRDWNIRNRVFVSCLFPRSLQHCLVDIAQFKPTALWKEQNVCLLSCFCHLFHCCVTHLSISTCIIFFHLGESPLIIVLFLMSVYVWTFLLVGFFQISAGVHCR